MARVLVACEESGTVRDAFLRAGHYAISVDLRPSRSLVGPHFQGPIDEYLRKRSTPEFDLIIAHPPCTYLNLAGVRWLTEPDSNKLPLKGKPRMKALRTGSAFFNWCLALTKVCPRVCVENPVMNPYAAELCGKYSQTFQPWQFGEPQFKRTALWLRNLPHLEPTKILVPPKPGTAAHKQWSKVHRASPGAERAQERSVFFKGVARAMAAQWGPLL